MDETLNECERASLLGVVDAANRDNYDRQFYETMRKIPVPGLDEIDDRVRRAIALHISKAEGTPTYVQGAITVGFIHGYMVGRELKRDIRRQ